ncbi:MMPL family transporter [Methylocystis sp. JAN1]|uniref:MMPL family transporter n=1 Tax=Methylocystis sp. JAN1 TaxID=3397211 RepID=UPI003FA1AFC4
MLDALLFLVDFASRHRRIVIVLWLALAFAAGAYAFSAFALDTDVNNLISRDLPWRKRELAYQAAFPQGKDTILVVVDAPTAEQAGAASRALAGALQDQPALFHAVQEQGGGRFFVRNRFMFLPTAEVENLTDQLVRAKPILTFLVSDQSLRGVAKTLVYILHGLQVEGYSLDSVANPLNAAADILDRIAQSQPAAFSWAGLMRSASEPSGRRRLILVQPKLFTNELEPGKKASDSIRNAAAALDLHAKFQAVTRLTGPVPLADEQFASVREGSAFNGVVTGFIVIAILWAALRSLRLVAAVVVCLAAGLLVTAGVGLLVAGALNPISIAFAMLFIGLGADFAVQYTVRFRAQRHEVIEIREALKQATEFIGVPLTLAAVSAAAGFLSFMPTHYRGLAQLGEIAGLGMIVAFALTFTLLPALLQSIGAPIERRAIGQPGLAPVDRFLRRRRDLIIGGTALFVTAGVFFLPALSFDFNPLHLQRKTSEAVQTFMELSRDPYMDANSAQIVIGPDQDARAVAAKIATIPNVAESRTIHSFIPSDQNAKLDLVHRAGEALLPALQPPLKPTPTDHESVSALETAKKELESAAGKERGAGAQAARRLANDIGALISADAVVRERAAKAFLEPLKEDIGALQLSLNPAPVTLESLPRDFVRLWISEDGRQRVGILPKGDPNSDATIRDFASAVLAVEPNATGQAIAVLMWSRTMIAALAQAALIAFCVIAIILWIPLRRIGDVLLTLVPLIVAAIVTLEICALSGFKLNYANIISFPVLLGVGVAFKIYYIAAWRRGESAFLQSPLTRAVFFSALLTATAFGSLSLSSNPGMSSMGQLLALSLACTLASAVLFQPALMGEPRQDAFPGALRAVVPGWRNAALERAPDEGERLNASRPPSS